MTERQNKSSLRFRSNLLVRTGPVREDTAYLQAVHDPRLLTKFRKNDIPLTPLQREEYRQAASPCALSSPDDYSWGTWPDETGTPKVVCRCIKTDCTYFYKCRPDFSPDELKCLKEEPTVVFVPSTQVPEESRDPAWEDLFASFPSEPAFHWTDTESAISGLSSSLSGAGAEEDTSGFGIVLPPIPSFREVPPDTERFLPSGDYDEALSYYTFPPVDEPAALEQWERDVQELFWPDGPQPQILSTDTLKRMHAARQAAAFGPSPAPQDAGQNEIVRLPSNVRAFVSGGPGTGKTWTLIERLLYLIGDGTLSPDEIYVLTFSNAARTVVQQRLSAAIAEGRTHPAAGRVPVLTFHSFAGYLRSEARRTSPGLLKGFNARSSDSYAACVLSAARVLDKEPGYISHLKHLLVDETQDLCDDRAHLLLSLARALPSGAGFTFFGDPCQGIYDFTSKPGRSSLTSLTLGERLTEQFPEAYACELTVNHRCAADQNTLSGPVRKALLGKDTPAHVRAVSEAGSQIPLWPVAWKDLTEKKLRNLAGPGTIGIVTRVNIDAALISEALLDAGIPHTLAAGSDSDSLLGGWLYLAVSAAGSQTLDRDDFSEALAAVQPDTDPDPLWDALTDLLPENAGRRYEVRDLLLAASRNARDLSVYAASEPSPSAVTVSTVHRAKGLEFDTVLMTDGLFSPGDRPGGRKTEMSEEEVSANARVAYVALTRAKNGMYRLELPESVCPPSQLKDSVLADGSRRYLLWHHASARKSRQLRAVQFSSSTDLDAASFASGGAAQDHLLSIAPALPDMYMELRREGVPGSFHYVLIDPDRPGLPLARVSEAFMTELERILRGSSSKDPVFPESFTHLSVSGLVSHVSPASAHLAGARTYGDTAAWLGLQIEGLATASVDATS